MPSLKPGYRMAASRESAKVTRDDRKWPVTWVGVAGFEPAASSSRTKRAAKLRYTPPPASWPVAAPLNGSSLV